MLQMNANTNSSVHLRLHIDPRPRLLGSPETTLEDPRSFHRQQQFNLLVLARRQPAGLHCLHHSHHSVIP
jgi:hypothetical protein